MNTAEILTLKNLVVLITDVVLVFGGYCFGYSRGRWRLNLDLEYWVAKADRADLIIRKLREKIDFLHAEIDNWQRRVRSLEEAIVRVTELEPLAPPIVHAPSPLKLVPASPGVTIIDTRAGVQLSEPPPGTEVIKKEFLSTLVPKEKL